MTVERVHSAASRLGARRPDASGLECERSVLRPVSW